MVRTFSRLKPPQPTELYNWYWYFAAQRQKAFYRKLINQSALLWDVDEIIRTYRFTNVYRAADRVSQYLIQNVIYAGEQEAKNLFFRIILFRLFNKIETWKALNKALTEITWDSYKFSSYNKILRERLSGGRAIYSAAYIMPSGKSKFLRKRKHENHLLLLEYMMKTEIWKHLLQEGTLEGVYKNLRAVPMFGNFLAYQYTVDLNYSEILNFSENDFIKAGPGALGGIKKCFSDLGDFSPEDVIRYVTERQEEEFKRRGLEFRDLWGRKMHLVDCQNVFCEFDKYARVRFPEVEGTQGRVRIKQRYKPLGEGLRYWFPPKWGINDAIQSEADGRSNPNVR